MAFERWSVQPAHLAGRSWRRVVLQGWVCVTPAPAPSAGETPVVTRPYPALSRLPLHAPPRPCSTLTLEQRHAVGSGTPPCTPCSAAASVDTCTPTSVVVSVMRLMVSSQVAHQGAGIAPVMRAGSTEQGTSHHAQHHRLNVTTPLVGWSCQRMCWRGSRCSSDHGLILPSATTPPTDENGTEHNAVLVLMPVVVMTPKRWWIRAQVRCR